MLGLPSAYLRPSDRSPLCLLEFRVATLAPKPRDHILQDPMPKRKIDKTQPHRIVCKLISAPHSHMAQSIPFRTAYNAAMSLSSGNTTTGEQKVEPR